MEKKSIFVIACMAIVCFGTFAAYSLYRNVDKEECDTFAANVEALSQDEGSGSSVEWSCWSEVEEGHGVWVCGDPCAYNPYGKGSRGEGKCFKK